MSLGGRELSSGKMRKDPERPGTRLEKQTVKRLAKLGARLTPGSGNQAGRPGDIELSEPETILFELKEISGRRVSPVQITGWLRKITREARTGRQKPSLVLGFPDMEGAVPKVWGMLPLEVLEALILAAGWESLEGI
jgi:hypothetical protein